jgi:hypothetical protein
MPCISSFFSQYKDIIGKPGEGLRSYRLFDIAILDTVVTILAGVAISYYWGFKLWKVLAILLLSEIFFHRLFCVRSGIDKLLFP